MVVTVCAARFNANDSAFDPLVVFMYFLFF